MRSGKNWNQYSLSASQVDYLMGLKIALKLILPPLVNLEGNFYLNIHWVHELGNNLLMGRCRIGCQMILLFENKA